MTKKKLLSLLLALAMLASLLPVMALPAAADSGVKYLEYDTATNAFVEQTVDSYYSVKADTTAWETGWYVVDSTVTISSRVTVTGDVNLILADGYTLTADAGITVTGNNSLTIYGQKNGTGALIAGPSTTVTDSGIGGITTSGSKVGGHVTVHGGNVKAYAGGITDIDQATPTTTDQGYWGAAGIGGGGGQSTGAAPGGTFTMYGGSVLAYGNQGGAGIGGGNSQSGGNGGSVNVYGGTLEAHGIGGGAGIGGGNNGSSTGATVLIAGGTVKAYGGSNSGNYGPTAGAGIGGGNGAAGGSVTISGGTVTATGGAASYNNSHAAGAGIGGGRNGAGGAVNITGGIVNAFGGARNNNVAMGIGRGSGNSSNGTLELGTNMRAYRNTTKGATDDTIPDGSEYTDGPISNAADRAQYMWTLVTRPITITAGSDTKPYDGTELTCSDYEVSADNALADGDYIAGITLTGSQINAGSAYNVAKDAVIKNAAGEDVTIGYNITYVDGTLTVTPAQITIVANSLTAVYDGTEKSVTSYYFLDADAHDIQLDANAFSTASVNCKQTKAGEYPVEVSGVTIGETKSTDGNYLIVGQVNGKLTISKKSTKIVAGGGTKVYDGTALTVNTYTVAQDADAQLATGDYIDSATLTGSQTVVGSSYNVAKDAVIKNAAGEVVTASYDIAYENGTLTVTALGVTITGGSTSKEYDGTALTYNVWADAQLATDDYIYSATLTGSQTVVGSSYNIASDAVIKNAAGENVTASYSITYAPGTLTVNGNSKTIKFKPADAELPFGDAVLTDQRVTITAGDLPAGHTATATVAPAVPSFNPQDPGNIGKEIEGEIKAIKIVNDTGDDVTDYFTGKDTTEKCKLTVVGRTITITADTASKVYDGTALTKDSYTIGGDALLAGHVIKGIIVTGSQTEVGSSANKASGAAVYQGDQDVTTYYNIQYVDGTLTVTAKDAPAPYVPSGGGTTTTYKITVEEADNGTVTASAKTAAAGTTVKLTVTPGEGYELDTIKVTAAKGGDVAVKDNAFTMPADDVTVKAAFKEKEKEADPCDAFTDLDTAAWYHDGVHYALEKGYMQGEGNGIFNPNGTTTRAVAAQLLWNMAGKPVVNAAIPFADVKPTDWFAQAVSWAADQGIVNGWTDETTGELVFHPDDIVTREQFAAMLYRYAKLNGLGFTGLWSFQLDFPDVADLSDWAVEPMSWMVMNGIIKGMDGKLNPKGSSTRAQIAVMIQRYDAIEK